MKCPACDPLGDDEFRCYPERPQCERTRRVCPVCGLPVAPPFCVHVERLLDAVEKETGR
jgi:hypothetical protein